MNNNKTEKQRIEEIYTDFKSVLLLNKAECYRAKLDLSKASTLSENVIDSHQELPSLDKTKSLISQSHVIDSIIQYAQPGSQESQEYHRI